MVFMTLYNVKKEKSNIEYGTLLTHTPTNPDVVQTSLGYVLLPL
jgi:hypothetical protein